MPSDQAKLKYSNCFMHEDGFEVLAALNVWIDELPDDTPGQVQAKLTAKNLMDHIYKCCGITTWLQQVRGIMSQAAITEEPITEAPTNLHEVG